MSTRFSSRGHRFEQSVYEDMHKPMAGQLPDMFRVLKIAEEAAAEGNRDAEAQVNRMRGQLANWRKVLTRPDSFSTADIFMTIARHVLPQEFFDGILAEVRLVREGVGREAAALIDDALHRTQPLPPVVTFNRKVKP